MKRVVLALIALLSASAAAAEERRPVDAALILALDVSGSVTEDNWRTQRDGVASAVGSDQSAQAVRRGQVGRVAIAVVQWETAPRLVLGWRVVETVGETRALAEEIREMRRTEAGGTCLGTALKMITAELMAWEDLATRRIIDVGGDGTSNCGPDLAMMRKSTLSSGITINGLPIVAPVEPKVAEWYEENVIGGPGAFSVVADGNHNFAEAFLRKLTVEVAALVP